MSYKTWMAKRVYKWIERDNIRIERYKILFKKLCSNMSDEEFIRFHVSLTGAPPTPLKKPGK